MALSAMPIAELTAAEIIEHLKLAPHPEGGFYRETFRDAQQDANGRAASTLIYFLLPEGVVSAWHRVDAVETWHFYAGAALKLQLWQDHDDRFNTSERDAGAKPVSPFAHPALGAGPTIDHLLGPHLLNGESPQCVVPRHCWQRAESAGAWTLVGCGVSPGFQFDGFEIAPEGWQPPAPN